MEAIIAINKLGYIGLKGSLPWRCSDDLKHFKKLTMGKKLVVGRKTAEQLPNLKGREVFILGKDHCDLKDILQRVKPDFVIGGAMVYDVLLPLCSVIHVSRINDYTIGDTKYQIPKELLNKVINYEFNTNESKREKNI